MSDTDRNDRLIVLETAIEDLAEKLSAFIDGETRSGVTWETYIDTKKQLEQTEKNLEELIKRTNGLVARYRRLTQLLRNTLPAEKQVGVGIEGMVQSLLAYLVELQNK